MKNIVDKIKAELERAKKLHPNYPTDIFKQLAIMQEEAGEVTKAVYDNWAKGTPIEDVETELIQTAAMCVRMLESINRIQNLDLDAINPGETFLEYAEKSKIDFIEKCLYCFSHSNDAKVELQSFIIAYDQMKDKIELEAMKDSQFVKDEEDFCTWEYDSDCDVWTTGCECSFVTIADTPLEDGIEYCPHCVKKIKEKK